MDKKDAFRERERAFEEGYFRTKDAQLIDKLRQRASLAEIAKALKEKLQVDDPGLLEQVRELGLTPETGPALLVAPLVQVAWAEGNVSDRERQVIVDLVASRGVAAGTPAHAQLLEWLQRRPPDRLFDIALAVIKKGFSVLPRAEREERVRRLVEACDRVAHASGGLTELLGLGGSVSGRESALLDAIAAKLRVEPAAGDE